MSGTNQAANLSGLFAGFETKLQDPKMFNRGIENTFRPDFGTSEQGLLEAAAWEAKMGRSKEANALTAISQQKQLARTAELEALGTSADGPFSMGMFDIAERAEAAVQNMDPEALRQVRTDYAKMVPMNADQGRMRSAVDLDGAGTRLQNKIKKRDVTAMTRMQAQLDAELAKPESEQNAPLVSGTRNALSQWRKKADPESVKEFDSMRSQSIDLREQEKAAEEGRKLNAASKTATSMAMQNTPVAEIKNTLLQSGFDLEQLAPTFTALESLESNIASLQQRENETDAARYAEETVISMIDSMVEMAPEKRDQMKVNVRRTLRKAGAVAPKEALKQAEFFMKQVIQFNMGVEQDRLREWARSEGDFRSIVNQMRARPLTDTVRNQTITALDRMGVDTADLIPDLGKIANTIRLAENSLDGYGWYETENGKLVVKDGKLVPIEDLKNINKPLEVIYDDSNPATAPAPAGLPPYITRPLENLQTPTPNSTTSPQVGLSPENPIKL